MIEIQIPESFYIYLKSKGNPEKVLADIVEKQLIEDTKVSSVSSL